jgi:hypothetical protein
MADDGHDSGLADYGGTGHNDERCELSTETRLRLRELGALVPPVDELCRPASRPARPLSPLGPLLAGLLLIVTIAVALMLGLTRSGAVTILGVRSGDTESSLNWAGYVTTHARFTSVTATWTVPAVRATSDSQATASFWVGLDGRDSRSLQQIGTTSTRLGGAPRYGAWWEMLPGPAVDVPMTITAGDSVTASVVADGGGTFTLSLRDTTNGQQFSTRQVDAAARLSSAEVVAEAPSSMDGLLPLADFGRVHFTGARVNGRPIGAFAWSRVNMTTGARRQATALGLTSGGSSFTVVWDKP